MLTILNRINQKLPYVSESVLQEVWIMLDTMESSEEKKLSDEFDRWEAASDEDSELVEEILITK